MTGIAPSASATLQQQPGIRALGVGRGARALKRKAALGQERIGRRENPRVLRLVQIQAARIVAREQAERLEADRGIEIEEVQRRPARSRLLTSPTIGSSVSTNTL